LPLVFNFDHTKDYQFEEKLQLDPLDRRHLSSRHRRPRTAAGHAHHGGGVPGDSLQLERH
jgi:hypothetical protein